MKDTPTYRECRRNGHDIITSFALSVNPFVLFLCAMAFTAVVAVFLETIYRK